MDASERRERTAEEAAEWFVRLQAADVSRAERADFVAWLRESHLHVAELLRVAQVHGALGQFERWASLRAQGSHADEHRADDNTVTVLRYQDGALPYDRQAPAGADSRGPDAARGSPRLHETCSDEALGPGIRLSRSGSGWFKAAAVAVVLAVAIVMLLPAMRGQIIETERGERREVALADGSTVQVDPESRLRIKFERQSRGVFLEKGRAVFHVARNVDRPFLVQAEGTVVRAVGTAFGVDRHKPGVVVTVAEGKVAVFNSNAPATLARGFVSTSHSTDGANESGPKLKKTAPGQFLPPQTLFLTADQQVKVQSSGSAEPVRTVDSGRELAWAEGRLVFDNETVAAAIEQFNRYNRVQLHVTDESLARRTVSAVFNASEPESFIAFIQSVAPVRLLRGNGQDITFAPSDHSRDQ